MIKHSKEIGEIIIKLNQAKEVSTLSAAQALENEIICPVCNCKTEDHDSYIYCEIIGDYICDVCCCYEVCNDYQLVNRVLEKDLFENEHQIRLLCEYCQNQ